MTLVVCLIVGLKPCQVDVPVSTSSAVVVMSEDLLSDPDSPESVDQGNMSLKGTLVKAQPASRRKIMPPTPQQSSQSSIEAMQRKAALMRRNSKVIIGGRRTVIARMEQYLNKSDSTKVEIEELEFLLGREDSEVNMGQILSIRAERAAGSLKSSARKVRVSTWLSTECEGMIFKG